MKGRKVIFEITMAEIFQKLMTDPKPQIQKVKRILSRINTAKFFSHHVIFKLQKIFKAREKET